MKITLDKLGELKEYIKLSWLARASGWDRASMYKYMSRSQDMTSTPNAIGRLREVVGALKKLRRQVDRVIRYYEDLLVALDHSGAQTKKSEV